MANPGLGVASAEGKALRFDGVSSTPGHPQFPSGNSQFPTHPGIIPSTTESSMNTKSDFDLKPGVGVKTLSVPTFEAEGALTRTHSGMHRDGTFLKSLKGAVKKFTLNLLDINFSHLNPNGGVTKISLF